MADIIKYREKGSSEIKALAVTDDYGDLVLVSSLSDYHLEYFQNRSDWHGAAPIDPLPVLKIAAKHFDFHARTGHPVPYSASAPTQRLPRKEEGRFNIPCTCSLSGLHLGEFYPMPGLLGRTPYVKVWQRTSFLHPVFSLSLTELVYRAESCWNLEKSGTRNFPLTDKKLMFLALLHASELIKQDVPGLPSTKIVETHFMEVLEMVTWKKEHNGARMNFPRFHVWQGAAKEDINNLFHGIPVWLAACNIVRDEYENIARTRQKEAKVKAKELALKSIRAATYKDISLKRLWNWICSQVPQSIQENNPDLEQLFFVEESSIHLWQKEDIEALETVFLKYCELGNSVSHEVSKRIRQLTDWRNIYYDTFEIVVDHSKEFAEHVGKPEPLPKDFPSRAGYLVAHAKWKLGNKSADANKVASKGDDL